MKHTDIDALRACKTFPQLAAYLRDELEWPIEAGKTEDITFEYEPSELGIEAKAAVRIKEIKQLRPFAGGQPWGIFFINFEKKRLPVVVMRLILRALVLKKRASANKADRQAWQPSDLLFISAYGEDSDRSITFAHFVENPGNNSAELRVLGWDDDDTPLHMDYVARMLHEKLRWDDKLAAHPDAWRQQWSDAFLIRHRFVITKSEELAVALADLARRIRSRVGTILRAEDGFGQMRKLQSAFRTALIHDLTDDGFADMFAQTVTYGLFSVSVRRTFPGEGTAVTKDDVPNLIFTSPFLKEMLGIFLGIKSRKGKIDFDELGVSDVTDFLQKTDMELVLRDFNNKTRGEDPVIHFYEHFLSAYNKEQKIKRGVFYTPQPVVSYIVRSVHELLQTEFGLADGLADTTTWGGMLKKHPGLKLPPLTDEPGEKRTISPDEPFVQILDPATGTATFLVEVIDVIHRTLAAKWKQQRLTDAQQRAAWNDYVPQHLLPRLHAFELMMAPYAIAHMKIGLKLAETGYRFGTEERARIYLTNALEPWVKQLPLIGFDALAHEAAAVNEIKRHKRFTVVIGNPPYSKMSGNLGEYAVSLIEQFRYVHGERIIEKGALALELNLQDDYVKFWALLRHSLITTNVGIGAYITNSRYLASPTLRGLRWNLKELFDSGRFLDLGGQVSERAASPGADENVFDIEQGVAVGVGVRTEHHTEMASVGYNRCRGTRDQKYSTLNAATVNALNVNVLLEPPFFRYSRGVDEAESLFSAWHDLNEVMPFNSGCIITSRDNLALDFDRQALLEKITRFSKSPRGDRTIEQEIGYSSKSKWDVEACKASIRTDPDQAKKVRRVLYRPFDERWIYYSTKLLDTPSKPVCDSVFDQENLVLFTPKVNTSETFNHVLVSRVPAEKKSCSHDRATQMFPLYRYESGLIKGKQSNLGRSFESAARAVVGSDATPEACFAYIYAVLNSPEYRRRFGNALRDSYPRIPITTQPELFRALARLGGELTALHLLESPELQNHITDFVGENHTVSKIGWTPDDGGTVWIDGGGTKKSSAAGTSGFIGVPEEVWNFHIGGYQVCEKWLKDRKGRELTREDRNHYQEIVVALSNTIRLMAEIDEVIETNGGWPGAFHTEPIEVGKSLPPEKEGQSELFNPAASTIAYDDAAEEQDQDASDEDGPEDSYPAWMDDEEANVIAIRRAIRAAGAEGIDKEQLLHNLAHEFGYDRLGPKLRSAFEGSLQAAALRGILYTAGGQCYSDARSIEDYDKEYLKILFLAANGRVWVEREEAYVRFARHLGFIRTSPNIRETAKSLINGLIRQQRLEYDGTQIRRIPNSDPEGTYDAFVPKGIKFSPLKTLEGHGVAVTGYLDLCTHETAGKRIERAGGIYKTSVSSQTDILVIGNLNPLYKQDSAGNKIIKAQELNQSGEHEVRFMRLSNFLRMIGM